jgi:3D (Asp-Asp-Asp) domain-containing protein
MKKNLFLHLSLAMVAGCANNEAGAGFSRVKAEDKAGAPVEIRKPTPAGCCHGKAFASRATGYYPFNDKMQGGYVDRKGRKLRTLQDFLDGKADYVSVAMDVNVAKYGTRLCIPEIEDSYGRAIEFRLVDTGGAFKGKKTTRMDICSRDRKSAHLRSVNRPVTLVVCED